MKYETYDELYGQFSDALVGLISGGLDPVKTLSEALALCRKFLIELRAMVVNAPFANAGAEIHFFKHVKPKFYAQKILHFEVYGLDMNRPVGAKDMLLSYYNKELTYIERFFALHAPVYHYYRVGGTELDSMYFIRGAEVSFLMTPEIPEADPHYSTLMDYLFARFIAYELLQKEILRRIGLLDSALIAGVIPAPSAISGIKWTGKIVNLSELVYGLFYTGQLNNGNVQLSEIVALFERMFLVKIRDVHHTFGEIRERKVSSPSKFIESMAVAIKQRVDDDLSYKPN